MATAFASPMSARCFQKNCDLRQVKASTPGSSSPRLAIFLVVLRWEDVEEAQERPMNAVRRGHCTWEEGVGSAIPVGVPVPVALHLLALHLFACLVLQEQVGVVVS